MENNNGEPRAQWGYNPNIKHDIVLVEANKRLKREMGAKLHPAVAEIITSGTPCTIRKKATCKVCKPILQKSDHQSYANCQSYLGKSKSSA